MDIHHFYQQATQFANTAAHHLHARNLDVSSLQTDHICYRVERDGRYHIFKRFLSEYGSLLSEATINGRPIATFKLYTPISHENGLIPCVELPSPKNNQRHKEGFEHIEYVVPSMSALQEQHPHLEFKQERYGQFNPTLSLRLGHFSVKFHERSLEEVIGLENAPSQPSS